MGYYRSDTVPPKGSVNSPQLIMFDRQAHNDIFTEWKYNAVIDNLELFISSFLPFHISGCNITYVSEEQSEGYIRYTISNGFVFCNTLIYIPQQYFETPYTNDIYVVLVDKDGVISAVLLSNFDFNYHILSLKMCKIGYVCRTVRMAPQEKELFLKDLPLETVRYNAISYYGGYGAYQ